MTKIDQLKILDNKIRASKAQYDLDRKNAEISALSNGELEKYEYLTEKDLGIKPDVIQKAKFDYSPLGKVFNKGLDESDKKVGLLKRLKNIEGKSEQQLQTTKNQETKQVGTIENEDEDEDEDMQTFYKKLRGEIPREETSIFNTIVKFNESEDARKEANRLKNLRNTINYDKLFILVGNNRKVHDFSQYMELDTFAMKICYDRMSLE